MSLALRSASRLKPEIRLAQAISEFEADLSGEQKAAFRNNKAKAVHSPPDIEDVLHLTAEIDRAIGKGGRCLGPRFVSFLQGVQKFAALGDIMVGGSQNLVACGVWTLVRTSLMLMTGFPSYMQSLSLLFMNVGRSAPRFECMALLYPHSRDLQASLFEYFIVVVQLCHAILKFANKSGLKKFGTSLCDSNLTKYQTDLESWGNAIKDEVGLLMAMRLEEESSNNSQFRPISRKFFKKASNQQSIQARQQVLDLCSTHDYLVAWKQTRRVGQTTRFLHCPHYQAWRSMLSTKDSPEGNVSSPTLIFTGKLGAGKSVMLASIVSDLHLHNQSGAIPVIFFFIRPDISDSLKAETVMGSITRQLLSRVSALERQAELLAGPRDLDAPDMFIALLQGTFKPENKTFIVIDGLDELNGTERARLMQFFRKIQNIFKVALCASIRQEANTLKSTQYQLNNITFASIPDNTADIKSFILEELETCITLKKLAVGDIAILLEIQDALTEGSQGMFLWVALQIESLCAMETDEGIRYALANLPKGLSETFRRILEKPQRPGSLSQRRILELLIVAERPLTLEELREALSVTPGDTTWRPDWLLNNINGTLACCGSLVIIDEEELTLRLIHHSVKQYLLRDFRDPYNGQIKALDAHKRMAEIIITYLSFSAFDRQISSFVLPEMQTGKVFNDILQSTSRSMGSLSNLALKLLRSQKEANFNMANALAEASHDLTHDFFFRTYAMAHWSDHIHNAHLSSRIIILFLKLCEKMVLNLEDLTAANLLAMLKVAVDHNEEAHVLLIANKSTSSQWRAMGELNINSPSFDNGRTLLHVAVSYRSMCMTRCVLNWTLIDIAVRDQDGKTPFGLAFDYQDLHIVKIFLAFGRVDSQKNDLVESLFRSALQSPNRSMVIKILKNAITYLDLDLVQKIIRYSPLGLRSMMEVWQLIWIAMPPSSITRGPHLEILHILLDREMIPFLGDDAVQGGCDPLHKACKTGHIEIVELLIHSNKLNVYSLNQFGNPALHSAIEATHIDIVKVILRFGGISAEIKRTSKWPCLRLVFFQKRDGADEVMIDHLLGYDISAERPARPVVRIHIQSTWLKDEDGRTPLHHAAAANNIHRVIELVKFGPRLIEMRDNNERTAYELALIKENSSIVKILSAAMRKNSTQSDKEILPASFIGPAQGSG